MKKYSIYLVILIVGIFFGWLLFGGLHQHETIHIQKDSSKTNQTFTCAMHPQVMQPKLGDCPICGMALVSTNTVTDGLTANQLKFTKNAMALANIQTTIVGKKNRDNHSFKLSGKIAENEEENTVQTSYFSGRIERLHINFKGEKVRKGQLLATIYSPELYTAQQELLTAASLKETQPELYKAVRNKFKLWKISENQINKIESTKKAIENFPIYATVSGTVTDKLVAQGDYVKKGQALFKIANLATVWANFDVYENQIEYFKNTQKAIITTNAYPNKEFKGNVDFIAPVLNNKTRTVNLRVVLNNIDDFLKPGMFVSAKIEDLKNNNKTNLTIPLSAVLWTGKRSVVYLKTNANQPIFEMREIILGNKIGNEYEVLEGLFSGNEIVTNGTFTVDAAAQLQGKKSMMQKDNTIFKANENEPLESNYTHLNKRFQIPEKFQIQLKTVFNQYSNLKRALVKNDIKTSIQYAKLLSNKLNSIDKKLLSDKKAYNHWVVLEKNIEASATQILKSTDIKVQRNHFKLLSLHFIKAIQLFGIHEKVYVKFCPMVNDNKGGYWLSKAYKIKNPYFGSAMLTCGEIKQILE